MRFLPLLHVRRSFSLPALALVVVLAGAVVSAFAQERGGGGPPGGTRNPLGGTPNPPPGANRPGEAGTRARAQIGPPSRWWDDAGTAKSVGLNAKQQRRLDDVFTVNKPALLKLYTNLKAEEAKLARTTASPTVSETEVDQQIDRVSAARGELGKAYAHLQLQIRKELTPEQADKLEQR